MIPRSKVDEILDAARIEDVVGDYVSLKKRGSSLLGLCPFHNEKTPSFNVSVSKGIYKCFGCGKAGNAINFVMDYEHLDFVGALKVLADKYGIELPKQEVSSEQILEEKRQQSEKESLQVLNNYAEAYFADTLHTDDEGKLIGLSYFDERGFRPDIITKFKLGFAKDSWDHFTENALRSGYSSDMLVKSGLSKSSEQGKIYDAYRARVIFPIHGLNGKPIAFAGRILKSKDEKSPKYVNSPETVLYYKSNELYGLYFARTAISKADSVYLVEGYTDVISMHQAGIENVVASSGTSLTENQIKLIKRFTENVCVLYDGDAAGIKASLRGTDMLLEAGLNVKIVLFPDGEDPDSYSRKVGSDAFDIFLSENKQDFILFKTGLLKDEAGNDPVKQAELVRDIVGSISKIPDAFKRSNFIKACSRLLKVEEQLLIAESNRLLRTKAAQEARTTLPPPAEQPLNYEQEIKSLVQLQSNDAQERDLLRVLLKYATHSINDTENVAQYVFRELAEAEIVIENPVITDILKLIHAQLHNQELNMQSLLYANDPKLTQVVADMMSENLEVSPHWSQYDVDVEPIETYFRQDVEQALLMLKVKHINKLIDENQLEFNHAKTDEDLHALQQVHAHLLMQRSELLKPRGTVLIK
ncbi:MAG: DNA primase [Bacteroidota bacterium]